jgi:hypothetical protein
VALASSAPPPKPTSPRASGRPMCTSSVEAECGPRGKGRCFGTALGRGAGAGEGTLLGPLSPGLGKKVGGAPPPVILARILKDIRWRSARSLRGNCEETTRIPDFVPRMAETSRLRSPRSQRIPIFVVAFLFFCFVFLPTSSSCYQQWGPNALNRLKEL